MFILGMFGYPQKIAHFCASQRRVYSFFSLMYASVATSLTLLALCGGPPRAVSFHILFHKLNEVAVLSAFNLVVAVQGISLRKGTLHAEPSVKKPSGFPIYIVSGHCRPHSVQ